MKRKILRPLLLVFFTVISCFLVLEIAYRNYWFDFYANEWNALNPAVKTGKKRICLVFGDSFSAGKDTYLKILSDRSDIVVKNSSVPGTSAWEAALMHETRFEEVNPDFVLIQFYSGNDLDDLMPAKHPYGGFLKRNYKRTSSWWRSLGWINYKLGQFRGNQHADDPKDIPDFRPEIYNEREKQRYRAFPDYPVSIAFLRDSYEDMFEEWKNRIRPVIRKSKEESRSKIFLLHIPHPAYVSETQRKNLEDLGADLRGLEEKPYRQWPLTRELYKFCKEEEVYMIDGGLILQKSVSNPFYVNDPHLNNFGSRLLGLKVAKIIY